MCIRDSINTEHFTDTKKGQQFGSPPFRFFTIEVIELSFTKLTVVELKGQPAHLLFSFCQFLVDKHDRTRQNPSYKSSPKGM